MDFLYNGFFWAASIVVVPVIQLVLWKLDRPWVALPIAVLMFVPAVLCVLTGFYYMYGETGALERWEILFGAIDPHNRFLLLVSLVIVAFNVSVWYLYMNRHLPRNFRGQEARPLHLRSTLMAIAVALVGTFIYLSTYQTLADAVASGNLRIAQRRLNFNLAGVGPNDGLIHHFGTYGLAKFPLLPLAVKGGNKKMITILIDAGAKLNPTRWNETTAATGGPITRNNFYFAIRNEDSALVEFLIERGADPTQGVLPAVEKGNLEILRNLLEKGAQIDAVRKEIVERKQEAALDRMLAQIEG